VHRQAGGRGVAPLLRHLRNRATGRVRSCAVVRVRDGRDPPSPSLLIRRESGLPRVPLRGRGEYLRRAGLHRSYVGASRPQEADETQGRGHGGHRGVPTLWPSHDGRHCGCRRPDRPSAVPAGTRIPATPWCTCGYAGGCGRVASEPAVHALPDGPFSLRCLIGRPPKPPRGSDPAPASGGRSS
jgi:hypothetical protein